MAVAATVDFRGLFASYGHNGAITGVNGSVQPEMMHTISLNGLPGSHGVMGTLVCGVVQLLAVVRCRLPQQLPHLKAIFPMTLSLMYMISVYLAVLLQPGERKAQEAWRSNTTGNQDALAAPVDADTDSVLLKKQ